MKLVLKYISMYLKSELEYKSSFIMTLISQLITVSLSSFTVVILMDKFKFLNRMQRLQQDMGHSVSRESTLDDYVDPDFQDSTTGLFEEQYFADNADAIYWEDI